jgi:hypothetical protein
MGKCADVLMSSVLLSLPFLSLPFPLFYAFPFLHPDSVAVGSQLAADGSRPDWFILTGD